MNIFKGGKKQRLHTNDMNCMNTVYSVKALGTSANKWVNTAPVIDKENWYANYINSPTTEMQPPWGWKNSAALAATQNNSLGQELKKSYTDADAGGF